MKIWLNGDECVTTAVTLADLITEQLGPQAAVASALNGDFVPVSKRAQTWLSDDDRLEILVPVQGG